MQKRKINDFLYDDKKVGTYKPDFTIENKILVEIKAVPIMPKDYETQR